MAPRLDRAARRLNWLVYNLRWLLLIVVALLSFMRPPPEGTRELMLAFLSVAVLYNVVLTLLEFVEFWHPFMLWFAPVADAVFALGLYVASGASDGPLIWIGLLPGLTTGLRHRWEVALSVVGGFTLAQAAATLTVNSADYGGLAALAVMALLVWPLTVGASWVGQRLRVFLQRAADRDQSAQTQIERALRAHARALYEMSSMVSATLDYEKVLDAALNFGVFGAEGAQQAYSLMTSTVLTFRDDQLHVASGWRLPPADHRVLCPAREGVLGQVIRTSEPVIISDPFRDPELEQFVGFRSCRALMALPLRAGFETYGVVLYAHPRVDFFDQDKRAFLVAVVNQAIIALQNAQLFRNLREEKERLVEVQEEAQKKLARDLHDGPTQSVAALAMRANFARRLVERDPKAAGDELFKMEDLARRTTKEIRHMLFTLRPLVLESQGLTAALQQLAEKMRETHSQTVIVEAEAGIEERLELNQQGVLFYIVEEAVGNARKHAQAQHIWVRLKTQRDVLVLEIQDDGVGFNVGAVDANYDKRGSLGMVNMRERAEMLNGAVKVDSTEGQGTRITVLVPLNEIARV